MTPQEKASELINRFGNKAEDVSIECKNAVDAIRTPYWKKVKDEIAIQRLKQVVLEESVTPDLAHRY